MRLRTRIYKLAGWGYRFARSKALLVWHHVAEIRDSLLILSDWRRAHAEPVPEEVLYADRWSLKGLDRSGKREVLSRWLRNFVSADYVFPEVPEGSWVFFRSMPRDDYRAMFHAVAATAGLGKSVLVEDYRIPRKGFGTNLETRRFMRRNRHLRKAIVSDCPIERECLFVRSCLYSFILERFAGCRPAVIVFFADMQPVEHLLSLHFRSKGVTTVTMQHGLYVDYGDFDTVNKINYLHQPSEYFLSWGANTTGLIRRFHPGAKVVECGKPLIFAAETGGARPGTPYVAVLLDQKIFHNQNREMLRIVIRYASSKGLAVTVRLHPQLSRNELFEEFPEVTERLEFSDAELVVGHTSTMIYEAVYLGCRVHRYRSEAPAIPLPDSCEFSSFEELLECLSRPMPEGLGEQFFRAVGDAALRNYAEFFSGLKG